MAFRRGKKKRLSKVEKRLKLSKEEKRQLWKWKGGVKMFVVCMCMFERERERERTVNKEEDSEIHSTPSSETGRDESNSERNEGKERLCGPR